jgi:hypothetical protein
MRWWLLLLAASLTVGCLNDYGQYRFAPEAAGGADHAGGSGPGTEASAGAGGR